MLASFAAFATFLLKGAEHKLEQNFLHKLERVVVYKLAKSTKTC